MQFLIYYFFKWGYLLHSFECLCSAALSTNSVATHIINPCTIVDEACDRMKNEINPLLNIKDMPIKKAIFSGTALILSNINITYLALF